MKKILLATVAVFGFAGAAAAADLPSRYAPPPVIAAVPVFTWTGFYVGVNAGYGWNTQDNNNFVDPVTGIVSNGGNDGGFVGGGQVGYNYQIGQFVIGLETDIQYADLGGGRNTFGQAAFLGDSNDGNWFGTVRARAGFAIDRALIYATGGFAYGDIGAGSSVFVAPNGQIFAGSSSSTNTGWVVGGGLEYAFTDNLTAKIEGLYVNLDTENNNFVDPVTGLVSSGGDDGGFVGGGQVGYNYQIGSFVVGLETDIQYADLGGGRATFAPGAFLGDSNDGNWFGTVRARAGFAFDRALIYATGGFAYGDIGAGSSAFVAPDGTVFAGSSNGTNTGWVLGGGVEYAFTNNLTAKIEGLYVNLDTESNNFGAFANNDNTEFGVVRAGLNYKFSSY
jgi:outer membrane immunogenic protein